MNWQSGQDFQPGPDMGGYDFRNVNVGGGEGLDGFSDFFASMFGQDIFGGRRGGRPERQRGPTPGEDIEAEINLLVEELFKGGEKDIQIQTGGATKTVKVKIPPGFILVRCCGSKALAAQDTEAALPVICFST